MALTQEKIIQAALALIDKTGTFSMRKLAANLEVDPMAVYYYFPNKNAVMAAMMQAVYQQLSVPQVDDWREQIRLFAQAYLELAGSHANLIFQIASDVDLAAHASLDANEVLFAALSRAGLTSENIINAVGVIVDYLHGYLLGKPNQADHQAILQLIDDAHPIQKRVYTEVGNPQNQPMLGLEIIIKGIESLM